MEETLSAVASLVPDLYERREHKRLDQCFKAEFRVLSDTAALGAFSAIETRNIERKAKGFEAEAENFSYGGLGLVGDLDLLDEAGLQRDSFLELEIEIPLSSRKLRCVGSVAWIRSEENTGCFRAGLRFLGIDQEDLALVEGALKRLAAPWRWA